MIYSLERVLTFNGDPDILSGQPVNLTDRAILTAGFWSS